MKFKKLLLFFAVFSIANSFPLISSADYAGNKEAKKEEKRNTLDNYGNFPIGLDKKEKQKHKKILEKRGARSAIEQVYEHRLAVLDPKTPLSRYGKLKKQHIYEYIKDFFEPTNIHKLCFQFVFDKYDYTFSPLNFAAIQIASQFLLDGILGKYKKSYIPNDYDGYFGIPAMPIGALYVDYPIYIKNNKAREKLQEILNENYYNKKRFKNIKNSIINRLNKDDRYFEKVRSKMIEKLKSCLTYYSKKIANIKGNAEENKDKFYLNFGRHFLTSSINSTIDNSNSDIDINQNDMQSIAFARKVEKILKNDKKVKEIGKKRAEDIIKNLTNFKKQCETYIAIFKEENPSYYKDITRKEEADSDKTNKYSLKDVVISCLKKMGKKPTRPVLYNDADERYILKLDVKYDGMD